MRTLLAELFGREQRQQNELFQGLPLPVSLHNLHEHHRRSLVGWMANRMGQLLHVRSCESGALIYMTLSHEDIEKNGTMSEEGVLIYLSSRLYEWLEQGQDVYLRIKELKLSDHHHTCMLEVYEEIKKDLHRYFPQKAEQSAGENAIWQIYRDVIHAATQQKFLLIRQNEIGPYKQGNLICEAVILERSDIPKARDLAKQNLQKIGIPRAAVMSQLLVISEAVTNIIKHATQGKMTIMEQGESLHVIVEDTGPGFPLKILPYTTLMAGYSTKKSLGQGFTLMMKMTDRILLSTSPSGSTIILVFHEKEGVKHEGVS